MQLAILASDALKGEFLQKSIPSSVNIKWVTTLEELTAEKADGYIDLLFEYETKRIDLLATLLPKPVIINSVTDTLSEIGHPFIRINAWPGFLKRAVAEIAIAENGSTAQAEIIMQALGWDFKIVPDEPGMIAPRVVAMIINEAYYALGEQVSTKAEIDTAMKLGTNYPFGPFEWAEIIGNDKIIGLLKKLSSTDDRYLLADAFYEQI